MLAIPHNRRRPVSNFAHFHFELVSDLPASPGGSIFALWVSISQTAHLPAESPLSCPYSHQQTISLCSLPSLRLFPSCLRALVVKNRAQHLSSALYKSHPSAQNKANVKIGKIALNLYCEKPYDQIPPHSRLGPPKTKPIQIEAKPKSPCTSGPNHATHDPLHAPRYTLHATRFTLHASRFTLHEIRDTRYDSRDTRYEIRTPSPLRRPG